MIGLTGGIGAGKSAVARLLAARGAVLVDADRLAREVVAPGTPGLARVVAEFGDRVLAADGSLDRAALAALVFDDADARQRLNAVVHPLVAERTAAAVEAARRADPDAVVVHDVPLLVENGLAPAYDVVVVVDAPDAVRLDRLVRLRGMDPAAVRARMAAQASREERAAVATVVLDNGGSPADLERQVDRIWPLLAGHRVRDD